MNATHKDFIAQYTDVYPEGYCQHLINEFERLVAGGAGSDRQKSEGTPKHRKNDMQLGLTVGIHNTQNFNDNPTVDMFFSGLQKCYDEYTDQYSTLKEDKIKTTIMKMQRTSPGGGYHIWHSERGPTINSQRILVYMLYLNTLQPEEAGETEFLYQQTRLRPQENTMVLWPAAYTHAHRGNVVHGHNNKYIVTGWFYYE
tara:strand:- start:284 stop:880 length:597 start_codon:yes stop_codon:yes gene_type:complete